MLLDYNIIVDTCACRRKDSLSQANLVYHTMTNCYIKALAFLQSKPFNTASTSKLGKFRRV